MGEMSRTLMEEDPQHRKQQKPLADSKISFPNKAFETFAPHVVCASVLVASPILYHVVYSCVTGDGGVLALNDAYGYLGDVVDFSFLLLASRRYASKAARGAEMVSCAISLLSKALLWPLCAHIAASLLLDAKPPLSHSLKVASRAFWRVLATAVMAVLPVLAIVYGFLAACVGVFLAATGFRAPWFPRLELAATRFMDVHMAGASTPLLALTVLMIAAILYISCIFCFSLVMAAVEPETSGVFALRESAKLTRGFLSVLLLYNLQFHAITVNYRQIATDVRERDVMQLLLHLLFIFFIACGKVCAVVICCILYFRRRAAHVELGNKAEVDKVAAIIIRAPFEGNDKPSICELASGFDESFRSGSYGYLLNNGGNTHNEFND